jgi:hypothetical protein
MIRTLLLGFVLVIAAADGASAQGRVVYGFIGKSCGQWLEVRAAKGVSSAQFEAYVDGFLSGENSASTGPDFLAAIPNDKGVSIYIWIDNYCRDQPLNGLSQALMALKQELLARAR